MLYWNSGTSFNLAAQKTISCIPRTHGTKCVTTCSLSSHGKETSSSRVSKCRATLAVSHPAIVEESQKANKDVEALDKIVYSPRMPPSDVDQSNWSRPSLSELSLSSLDDNPTSDVSKLSNTITPPNQPPTTTIKSNKSKASNIVVKSTRSHRQSIKKRSTSSKIQSTSKHISTATAPPPPPPATPISAASLRAKQRSATHQSPPLKQTGDTNKHIAGDDDILNNHHPEIAKELEADAAYLKGLWSLLRSKQRGSGISRSSGVELSAISRFLSKSSDALLNKEQELRLGRMLQRGAAAQKVIDALKENNSNTSNKIHFHDNEEHHHHHQQQQLLLEATGAPSMKVLHSWLSSGQEARSLLYEYNIRLALKVAHRYSRSQTTSSTAASALVVDLFPEALVGLGKAVDRYDASKGFRFSTYAHWWILQSVSRAVNDQNRVIRIPQNILETLSKMNRASSNIMKADPYRTTPPSVEEIAKKIGVSEQKLLNVIRFTKEPISIDQTGEAGSKEGSSSGGGGMMPSRVAGRYSPSSGGSLSISGGGGGGDDGGGGGGGGGSIITAITGSGGTNSVTAALTASSSGGSGGGMYADIDDLAAATEEAEDHWFSPENEEHLKFCLTVVLSTLPTTRHENIVRMRYGLPPPSTSSASSPASASSSSNRLNTSGKGRVKSRSIADNNNARFLFSGDRIPLAELGETFNKSKERIRQIENEAMNLLRTPDRREMLKILMSKAKEDWPDDLKKKVERIFN